jgi:hypothetical protein
MPLSIAKRREIQTLAARVMERLKPLLKRTKGFLRLICELIRDEHGALTIKGRKPVPKGLLSKGHEPPCGLKQPKRIIANATG